MTPKPSASPLWLILAVLTCSIMFVWPSFYTWGEYTSVTQGEAKETLPKGKTIFLTLDEHNFGSSTRGFDPLFQSLESYHYDDENKKVTLKPVDAQSAHLQLPREETKAMVIYDKGFDSFQKREDILPIDVFPYVYKQQEENFFQLEHVDAKGTVYMEFRGKRIKLNPSDTYFAVWNEGVRVKSILIRNRGILSHEDFNVENRKDDEKEH